MPEPGSGDPARLPKASPAARVPAAVRRAALPPGPQTVRRSDPQTVLSTLASAASAGFGAAFGPPRATPTMAGRSTRSPITKPD